MPRKFSLVCLDTPILIWGIQGTAHQGQEGRIQDARNLCAKLDEDGYGALIPAVVVAEFLSKIPPTEHAGTLKAIEQRFVTAPFDAAAAMCFAKIWHENGAAGAIKAAQDLGVEKRSIKFDHQIIAIAVQQGASHIITTDLKMAQFAGDRVQVIDMPRFDGPQLDLFPPQER